MTAEELLRSILPHGVAVLLRNSGGTMELRGRDLAIKCSETWLTIYHATADGSEMRSHLHVRRGAYRVASVQEREGRTPTLEFWEHSDDAEREDRPPFALIFPSFYDRRNGNAPIPENQLWFRRWIELHGRHFVLEDA